jgi:hypothetical protein
MRPRWTDGGHHEGVAPAPAMRRSPWHRIIRKDAAVRAAPRAHAALARAGPSLSRGSRPGPAAQADGKPCRSIPEPDAPGGDEPGARLVEAAGRKGRAPEERTASGRRQGALTQRRRDRSARSTGSRRGAPGRPRCNQGHNRIGPRKPLRIQRESPAKGGLSPGHEPVLLKFGSVLCGLLRQVLQPRRRTFCRAVAALRRGAVLSRTRS